MLGKDVIIETLIRQGCDVTFGYPGGAVIPLFDSFLNYQGQIRNILVRHEQGAAHMAEGYAKVTGKPGVCIATSGPGATNLLTGIMDAYMDSVPMVAIGGQVPTHMVGNDAFQEADLIGMTIPVTKHNWQITRPNDLAPTIVRAFRLSVTGRPGPVYLDIPKDVQQKEVTAPIPDEVYAYSTHRPHIKGDLEKLKQAADMVLHAQRPLIVCGGGVVIANASHEMTRLAESLHIPVTSTLMGKGGFPELHPLSLGVLGMHGHEVANWCVINSDVMLVVGCRFSDRITGDLSEYAKDTKVIHIDIDPAELGKNVRPDIPIIADAKSALEDLYRICQEKLKKGNYAAWHEKIKELTEIHDSIPDRDVKGISQKDICLALNRVIKDDDIVTTGVGQHQMFAEHYLIRRRPRTWLTSGGAGTMGFGFPAAMGAKVARPDVEVFDIDGDGSFQMTSQELATCKESGIKVTPIIFNNSYLGMVRQWLELFSEKRYSDVHFTANPDFVKLAQAYGLSGLCVTRKSELDEALRAAVKSPETMLLDVPVELEENIFPILPPGGALQDIMGGKSIFKSMTFAKKIKK